MNGKRAAQVSVEPTEIDRPSSSEVLDDEYMHVNPSVIDLYAVGEEDNSWVSLKEKEVLFTHWLWLHGPKGEVVRVNALFDGGAMVGAMCSSIFKMVKHQLHGQTRPSDWLLCMANGIIIRSQAVWKGTLELSSVHVDGEFEVFDSGRGWTFLFGKPLLWCFQVVHDFDTDTVSIRLGSSMAVLHNNGAQTRVSAPVGNSLTSNVEQQGNSVGGSLSANPPLRQVLQVDVCDSLVRNDESRFLTGFYDMWIEDTDEDIMAMAEGVSWVENNVPDDEQGERQGTNLGGNNAPPLREVLNHNPASEEAKVSDSSHSTVLEYMIDIPGDVQLAENTHACQTKVPWMEQDDFSGGTDEPPSRGVPTHHNDCEKAIPADAPCLVSPVANTIPASPEEAIFTCQTEPFLPARVAKILELVQIGNDISEAQHSDVKQLVSEFADCFALSLSEVNLVPGAVHKLNIPEGSTFPTKIPQRSYNPDQ